jgi:rhodanese-related sulfurtransferase
VTADPDDLTDLQRLTVGEARALIDAGRAVFVDTRDRRLYDNAHAEGALSLPLAEIAAAALPADRILILYCA